MSAFVVTHAHINAIVRWASQHHVRAYYNEASWEIPGQEQETAECLLAENVISVNHRYSETRAPDAILYNPAVPSITPIAVIKAVHCLEYQSCEHPGWESSKAFAICHAIKESATNKLPGYDAAAWEIRP